MPIAQPALFVLPTARISSSEPYSRFRFARVVNCPVAVELRRILSCGAQLLWIDYLRDGPGNWWWS